MLCFGLVSFVCCVEQVEHRNGRTTAVPLCGIHRQNCLISNTTITITHGIRKLYQGADRVLYISGSIQFFLKVLLRCIFGAEFPGAAVDIFHIVRIGGGDRVAHVLAGGGQQAPVILQVSKGARAYANHTYLVKLVEAAVECCPDIPIVLHLDHGPDFETCKSCIDGGFTSVMIDASGKPFAENIEITKKVVEYAHDHGVVVEAELGTLAGIEDEVKVAAHEASYTRPEEVEEFVSKTGCDSLAIAIGTSHGAYKFKPEQCTRNEKGILVPPPLRFDVLEEVSKRLPGFPIVLHGSSSVPQEYVKMVNEFGGQMPNAIGVPEEQLRQAAKLSVCKINIDSDLRLAMTGTIRKFMAEHPDKFDPREYLKPARANIKELVRHKLVDVLGCAGKA